MSPLDRTAPPGGPDDPHVLVAPYAVGALDEAEARAAEDHLSGCPACQEELAQALSALAELGAAEPVEPPASLREAVLSRLGEVPQLPAAQAQAPARTPAPAATPALAVAPAPAPVDELAARRHRRAQRRRSLPSLAAAAAAVVVAGGLGWTALDARQERDAAQQLARAVTEVAGAPDAVVVPAAASSAEDWHGTRLIVAPSERRAVLVDGQAGPAPEDHTYQLWYVEGDHVRSAGTFDGSGGPAAVLSEGPGAASAVAVTVEPEGGSEQPTTAPVATYPMA